MSLIYAACLLLNDNVGESFINLLCSATIINSVWIVKGNGEEYTWRYSVHEHFKRLYYFLGLD